MTKLSGWLRHCVGLYRDEDLAVLNTKLIRQTMREGEKIPYTEVRRARFENYRWQVKFKNSKIVLPGF